MQQIAITILTVATMFAHAVMGCCWHGHDVASNDPPVATNACGCGDHHPVSEVFESPSERPDSEHESCCYQSCRAIVTSSAGQRRVKLLAESTAMTVSNAENRMPVHSTLSVAHRCEPASSAPALRASLSVWRL